MGNTFTIGKKFIHPVAESYFQKVAAAGGNVVDKNIVNTFVWELSRVIDPQFWVCWPLRSSQNIGTGITAYSLGGLGDFPGTLVNGPVWKLDGIGTDTSGQAISVSSNFFPLDAPCTAFYSFTKLGSLGDSNRLYSNAVSIGLRSILMQTINFSNVQVAVDRSDMPNWQAAIFPSPLMSQKTVSFSINGDNAQEWRVTTNNNASVGPDSFDNTKPWSAAQKTTNILRHSANGAASSYDTQIVFWASVALSDEQRLSLYTLYKNTLGKGLGLP